MIERLNGRTCVLIAASGLVLVVLVGWLGFVSPQRSKAAALAVQIDETETQLAVTQALVDGPILRRSTAELATLRTAIPDEVRMSQILRQLSKASGEARIRLLGITPAPVTAVGAADVVAMSLTIEGRYFAIREFLRLLRSRAEIDADSTVRASGRLFAIDSIQFTGGTSEGATLIQASLTVNAFAFSRPVAVPVAADGTSSGTANVQTGSEAATP